MGKYQLNIEQDFWNDFILEAFEHIEEIETNVITLEQNPDDMDIIHTMFRAFHTIKGLSGFVEHTVIQEVAHKTETLMDFCRKGELKVNSKIVDAILKASDYIKRLCEEIDSYKDDTFIDQIEVLLVSLENLANAEETDDTQASENKEESPAENPPASSEETPMVEAEEITTQESQEIQAVESKSADELFPLDGVLKPESEEKPEKPAKKSNKKTEEKQEEIIAEKEPKSEIIKEKEEQKAEPAEAVKEEKVPEIKASALSPSTTPEPSASISQQNPSLAKAESTDVSKKAIATNEEYMKVANNKIDHLVDMIGELIISQSLIEQHIESKYSNDNQLITNMSGFLRITRELQNLSMSLRMVSLKPTFQKISRIARDTIQELGKDVEFVTSGEGTEIDRVVTDKLLDPLVHLIKNAISHGVEEDAKDRTAIGKSKKARVELNAYNKRGKIFIEVKDDGRGIDTEIVYNKALEKGLIDPNKTYSKEEIREFILLPGFSTAKVVDNISGRGVGMDVVKTQILKIGGKVDIQSELKKGSTFTLEVPVNHAIMNGTVIDIMGQQMIVPTINVKEILQPDENQWIFTQQKRTMLKVRENIIPIVPMSLFFKDVAANEHIPLVMLLELDGELKALPINNVLNRQEVVVKPVGEEFVNLKYISGMSILGNGRVSLILDIDYMFKKEVKE